MNPVLYASGGSGGHLAPAIALAQAGAKLQGRVRRDWVSITRKPVDTRMCQQYPELRFVAFSSAPFLPRPLQLVQALVCTLQGTAEALVFLRRHRIGQVVATGGFGCVPVMLAAGLLGLPLWLHESNSIPGKVTRWFRPVLRKVYVTRLLHPKYRHWRNARETGFPIREDFRASLTPTPKAALGLESEKPLITIFGGSQGAKALTQMAETCGKHWVKQGYQVVCVTGSGNYQPTWDAITRKDAKVFPFIEDMGALLKATDLLIARSGAGSIAEIAAAGCPSILVPLPGSADDHQRHNANVFAAHGCGLTLEQADLDCVQAWVSQLLSSPDVVERMKSSMRTWTKENRIARLIRDIYGGVREGVVV